MKLYYQAIGIAFFCCCWLPAFSQPQDRTEAKSSSERWKVKKNKGMFGLAKPDFGPYSTIDVIKLDPPVHKIKIKDPDGGELSISGSEGIDITKLQTIEKQKQYKLLLGNNVDTTAAVFTIASMSKERKQTLLGKMLSKNEESSSAVLSYNRDVYGTITTGTDKSAWEFFIDDFTSGSRQTEERRSPSASIAAVYLKNDKDSFYAKFESGRSPDVLLYSSDTQKLATLEFTGTTAFVWVRQDIESAHQQAIAALFAVIIAIKDL